VTHLLQRTVVLRRPLAEVFEFFCRAENLARITPPEVGFTLLTPTPIEMRAGARIDYRLRMKGVPMSWRTHITDWSPPHSFVDEQERGPYRLWRHTHSFTAIPGGTRMDDRVEYALPLGALGDLADVVFVRRQLKRIFDYRSQQITRIFPDS
jgi:ligand-binding SRPBCC domain-containing protein